MSFSRAGIGRYSRIFLALSICATFALPAAAASISAPGLSQPGTISYDALGTPTIRAANQDDVAFLQGYAEAKARFFEMDFDRRAAAGNLAELVGVNALSNDVQSRTLGLGRAAWATWQALDDDTRGWLQSFSNGVNFWLQTNALPPEYGALMLTRAEPWTPVDSITVGKGLAFQLSFDLDIQNTIDFGAYSQAATAANVDVNALFFGDTHRFAPPDNHVTLPDFSPSGSNVVASTKSLVASFGGIKVDPTALALAQTYRDKIAGNPFIAPSLHPRLGRGGSNEFAVSGANTASGHPLIANDPHLRDGEPMPTRYWLVDPEIRVIVGRLESLGGVRRAEQEVGVDALRNAHARYAKERDALIPADWSGPRPHGGVGGTRNGVKCLHAHVAWWLSGGDDPVGRWVTEQVQLPLHDLVAS